jgi:hypothetical protein
MARFIPSAIAESGFPKHAGQADTTPGSVITVTIAANLPALESLVGFMIPQIFNKPRKVSPEPNRDENCQRAQSQMPLLGYRKAPERDKDAQQERSDDEDEMESFERHFFKQSWSFQKIRSSKNDVIIQGPERETNQGSKKCECERKDAIYGIFFRVQVHEVRRHQERLEGRDDESERYIALGSQFNIRSQHGHHGQHKQRDEHCDACLDVLLEVFHMMVVVFSFVRGRRVSVITHEG